MKMRFYYSFDSFLLLNYMVLFFFIYFSRYFFIIYYDISYSFFDIKEVMYNCYNFYYFYKNEISINIIWLWVKG